MNLFLENVDLGSTSGPNYFARKLVKYLEPRGVMFTPQLPYNLKLTFIESSGQRQDLPMIQRLDGIYFNANFDCERMNQNIKNTYQNSAGVIFQTQFNKNLIFNWFGPHNNYAVINNGSDLIHINGISLDEEVVSRFASFDNVWSCAAHWHVFKRLKDNVEYFLSYSKPNDCLVVAGPNPDYRIEHDRVFYVNNLSTEKLLTLFKISKYFIHLAYLDHCPNVVIDARAAGCQIICSSAGGTREIAGSDAIIIEEPEWDFGFLDVKKPPQIDYDKVNHSGVDSPLSMAKVAKEYLSFFKKTERLKK